LSAVFGCPVASFAGASGLWERPQKPGFEEEAGLARRNPGERSLLEERASPADLV
jgi:hypothetical protein